MKKLSLKLSYQHRGKVQEREVYPLVARIVSKRIQRGREPGSIQFEDALSTVVVACLGRFSSFDPGRNVHIHTFLHRRMEGSLTDLLKAEYRYRTTFQVCDFVTGGGGGEYLREITEDRVQFEQDVSNRLLAKKVLEVLRRRASPRGAYSLIAFHVDGLGDKQIAENLGTTVWIARKLRQEAQEEVLKFIPKTSMMVWG